MEWSHKEHLQQGQQNYRIPETKLNINNSKIKETAYKSLVRSTVEYVSSFWDPYHQNNKHRLEMVQRRTARYVTNRHHNTSSVSSMIKDLNWKSLVDRRKIAKLTMMYKLVNGLVLVNTEDSLIPPDRISRNNNTKAYQIPSCRTEIRKESYFPRTIRDSVECATGQLYHHREHWNLQGPPSWSILSHARMFLSSLYICKELQTQCIIHYYYYFFVFFIFACASKKVSE